METNAKHTVALENKSDLMMSGVCEVISYDEGYMELSLGEGGVSVEGEGLRITEFDSARGILTAHGTVSAIIYTDRAQKKRGLFGRKGA
jgi:sporulation protein YabP